MYNGNIFIKQKATVPFHCIIIYIYIYYSIVDLISILGKIVFEKLSVYISTREAWNTKQLTENGSNAPKTLNEDHTKLGSDQNWKCKPFNHKLMV